MKILTPFPSRCVHALVWGSVEYLLVLLQRETQKVLIDFLLILLAYACTYQNTVYLMLGPGAYLLLRLQNPSAQATISYSHPYESPENITVL